MGEEKKLPTTFYLAPPKPNPFGDGTSISYGLPFASEVRLSVFDVAGKKMRTLADGTQPAGRYSLAWDGSDGKGRRLANGVYFVRMKTPTSQFEGKVTLLR
jgi:flagellar hook assembly protein FlgD